MAEFFNKKIVVAHPGQQHSFHLASALKENGMLFKYVTTVYDKEDSLLMKIIKLFLGKEGRRRASRRKCEILDDEDVLLFETVSSMLLLLINRMDRSKRFSRRFNDLVSRRFQKRLAYYVIKNEVDVLICYDANCYHCFKLLKKRAPNIVLVMDNAAPNRSYLNKVYSENKAKCGPFINYLRTYKYLFDQTEAKRFFDEVKMADYHIVASSFSKKALEYDCVPSDRIFIAPYGVNQDRFADVNHTYEKGKLNLIFIGEVNQRKGIFQICEAARILANPAIRFNIIGSGYEAQKSLFSPYLKWVTFHGTAYFEELVAHLRDNDVLLFPSMGDGFGFVLLEAMASGLPVIASENSAAPDIVDNGVDGFIISPCNTQELVDRILWFYNNPESIKTMGTNARRKASRYTWEGYNKAIISSLITILGCHA